MAAKEGPESVNMVEADSIHWDPGMELTLKGAVQSYALLKVFLFGSIDIIYSFKLFNSTRAYLIYFCCYFTSDSAAGGGVWGCVVPCNVVQLPRTACT